jgi:DNA-binding beta-propeller fold protein YncE
MTKVGSGNYTYDMKEGWGKLPSGWSFGMVTGVAMDSQGRVVVLQRKMDKPRDPERPTLDDLETEEREQVIKSMTSRQNSPSILIFDREGNFITSWDNEAIFLPHTIFIDSHDNIYISERDYHVLLKFSIDGKLLMELGNRGQPSSTGCTKYGGQVLRPGGPFNMPCKTMVTSEGDIYVTDGDRNCRVHKFTSSGELLMSWGMPGSGPGQLWVPHGVWVDNGRVYVCDRSNDRIQIFTPDGEFVTQWTDFSWPTDIHIHQGTIYVIGQGSDHKVSVLDSDGNILARWAPPASCHSICVDVDGNIYAGEELRCGITKYVRG